MKIAIDMQTTLGQKTGIGFYVDNLVRSLEQIDSANQYLKLVPHPPIPVGQPASGLARPVSGSPRRTTSTPRQSFRGLTNQTVRLTQQRLRDEALAPNTTEDFRSGQRFWWDQVTVPQRARQGGVQLLHQPGFSAPVPHRLPVVVTVHDLIAIHFGADIPLGSRLYFGRWMPFSYRFADHIIAVSEYTKHDIVELLGIEPTKITTIPLAADTQFRPLVDQSVITPVLRQLGISGQFVLHLGTLNPRKNLEFLVRAFAKVRPQLDQSVQLVITGKKGWYYESLFQLVHDLQLDDAVVFTGYVSEAEKVALYNAATVVAFPSLYEGFGLPPLEAMQCGTPVIASQTSSIPEVVGAAARLLDPSDEPGWVAAMGDLLTNEVERQRLIELGLIQATQFSWQRTARETLRVYEQVVRQSN